MRRFKSLGSNNTVMTKPRPILGTNHVYAMLMFALENDGFVVYDAQGVVTSNYKTISDVCDLLEEKRLLTTRTFRRVKVVEQFYLTPKGREVALLLKAAGQLAENDSEIGSEAIRGFLKARFGEDCLGGMEWQPRIPTEETVLKEEEDSRRKKG